MLKVFPKNHLRLPTFYEVSVDEQNTSSSSGKISGKKETFQKIIFGRFFLTFLATLTCSPPFETEFTHHFAEFFQ